MVDAGPGSLRFSRSDQERLFVALVMSLLIHLVIWGGFEVGKKYGWWQHLHMPSWAHQVVKKIQPAPKPTQQDTQPTIFVEVDQPEATPPKNTMYYSDKNSRAANPDEDNNSNQPKLNGKQTDSPKLEDAPRLSKAQPPASQAQPLQPSPEPPQEPAEDSSPLNTGDQSLKKLAMKKAAQQPPAQPPKPRTLKEALEQNHLPGLQMHQDGAAHHRLTSSFDAKATPFGDYDRNVIYAVTERWYSLLDQQNFAQDRTGRVVVQFKLEYDGTVRDVEVLDNTVGDVLSYVCQAAIENAAPFGKWPDEMRQAIGANYREIKFTFDYY
jgi:hypothetical protein